MQALRIKRKFLSARATVPHEEKKLLQFELETRKLDKSVRGMPRLSEAKKDVTSCDKPR